ncbi:MAG: DUF6089 family protein [Tenacibaculum sp.]
MKEQVFILIFIISTIVKAQSHEIGFFAGGSNFIGDIGKTNYVNPNELAGGFIYKYNLNPRIALRGTYTFIPASGNDATSADSYRQTLGRSFANLVHEFATGIEFNFFDYNINNYKTRYTPYIFTKIAFFNYKSPVELDLNKTLRTKSKFSCSIPFGIGFKGLLINNLAMAFEIGSRYAFTDELDYSTPAISDLNFGGNGNDWYVFSGLSIVYTFGRPQCYSGLTRQ